VVSRACENDVMTLKAETSQSDGGLREAVSTTPRTVTKLGGTVDLVAPGLLPNDGKIIADERGRLFCESWLLATCLASSPPIRFKYQNQSSRNYFAKSARRPTGAYLPSGVRTPAQLSRTWR
jgi:hypothetical protein